MPSSFSGILTQLSNHAPRTSRRHGLLCEAANCYVSRRASSAIRTSTAASIQEARDRFNAVFTLIRNALLDYLVQNGFPDDAISWFRRNLEWNVPGGKLIRGLAVVDSLAILHSSPLPEEQYIRAAILGWCVELPQATFLVSDDIMDRSITRCGQDSWYRVQGVGMNAINDSFMLEGGIYHLLKKHFERDTTFQTFMGQLIDLITAPEDVVDLSKFFLRKHHLIVTYKAAYYSCYLPVALAMRARSILIPIEQYAQVRDDYLDCYGAPEVIGKIGMDIQDNKCNWPINVALESCTPEQRQILDANYGRKSAECEARVKEVLAAVDIPGKYVQYEEEIYRKISEQIKALPEEQCAGGGGLKREVFSVILEKLTREQSSGTSSRVR